METGRRAQGADKVNPEDLLTFKSNTLEPCSKKQKADQLWLLLSVTKNNVETKRPEESSLF